MKLALTIAGISVLLAGCAASGVQVKEEQLAQFEAGKTTVSDAIRALGQPNQQVLSPDGSRTLIYSYAQVQTRPETFIPFIGAFVGGADVKTNAAVLRFDRAGRLSNTTASSGSSGTGMGLASGTGAPERVPDQPRQAKDDALFGSRPQLGIRVMDLSPSMANSMGRNGLTGAFVAIVSPDSVAEKVGISPGDVITAYNGNAVKNQADLLSAGRDVSPGQTVSLKVARGQKDLDLIAQF